MQRRFTIQTINFMSITIIALIILLLIFFNALYVAAEFSTVSTRPARMIQIADTGNPMAEFLLEIIQDPKGLDTYVATCQVGITISSLMLGSFVQSSISPLVEPLLVQFGNFSQIAAASISATTVLIVFSLVQILLGELVPKNIGIQYPEKLALITAPAMRWSVTLLKPLIWLFNGSGQLIMKAFGAELASEHLHMHNPQEIAMLAEESGIGGVLERSASQFVQKTLSLRELYVRQVMIPRNRMLAASVDESTETLFHIIANSNYSRVPLYKDTVDNIVGVIHLKDLLYLDQTRVDIHASEIMRSALLITENTSVSDAIARLQKEKQHMAIVLDEYSGTAGIVSLEDLIEEILGEVEDEFDEYNPEFRLMSKERLWVRGDASIETLNGYLGTNFTTEDTDTVGGLVLYALGEVPKPMQVVTIDSYAFRVEQVKKRRVDAVSVTITPEQADEISQELSWNS